MPTRPDAAVLVPVKSFGLAKVRLAGALDRAARAELARAMAGLVVAAAAPLPVWCVCDDDDVAEWAREQGAGVEWTPGLGLNGAVQAATERQAATGTARVVVAHGDLPFARDLSALAETAPDEVVLVPDRRSHGTNVISVPTGAGFRFSYGERSFGRHREEVDRCGLRVRIVRAEHLGWDVDEPDDLEVPAHLGRLPGATS